MGYEVLKKNSAFLCKISVYLRAQQKSVESVLNPWNPCNFLKLLRYGVFRPVFKEFFGGADEAFGFGIKGAPEGETFHEKFAVGLAVDLGVAFEEVFTGFADPGFDHYCIAENSGVFVVDLVPGDHKNYRFLPVRFGVLVPVVDGGILQPLHIYKIADVIKHVDMFRSNRNCHIIRFV